MKTAQAGDVSRTNFPARSVLTSISARALTREQLLVGLVAIAFANGALLRAFDAADLAGPSRWTGAAFNTFGISVIVWAAMWIGFRFVLEGQHTPVRPADWLAGLGAIALTLVPSAVPAWLAMTGLAFYLILTSSPESQQRRGAWVLLAVTIPMCWSRVLFAALSDTILELEAILIGTAMGSPRIGNLVQFADGSGYMQVQPACSSLANVSLAILCWVTFRQATGHTGSALRGLNWCVLACSAVVLINVVRISLIGFFPAYYDLLHGVTGQTVAGWLTLGASVGICALGVRSTARRTTPMGIAHA